jgi:15-cis-phytoene synthase
MTPDQYCQHKTGGSGSSFYYSFLFLPPARRAAINALYAFCREVDDVVDETTDADVARATLDWWRGEIDATFAGEPAHPVTRALVPGIAAYRLPAEEFLAIIDGMQMDLGHVRYASFEHLHGYCYRVASVVGLLSAAIFGYGDPRARDYAADLGVAFQLTNIIRDVGEDAHRGRIYLPLDDLARFGVGEEDILHGRESPALRELMAFQAERAELYYERALAALPESDRATQLPGLVMAAIYAATLHEVRDDGFRVLHHKVALTPLRKLWIAWRTRSRERRRARERRPPCT